MSDRPINPYLRHARPLVIAHRGAGGLAPENTLPAFALAAAMPGVHALELDIHRTRDGVLVVSHDAEVDRITDGRGAIRDLTLAELQRLDAGYTFTPDGGLTFPLRGRGLRLPTLEAIYTHFQQHIINVDIKQHEAGVVEQFVQLSEQYRMLPRLMVGSFDTATVNLLRRLAPTVATAGSYNEVRAFYVLHRLRLARLWRGRCQAFQIPERNDKMQIITRRFIRDLHAHAVQLHVWTVNTISDMRRLLGWGVDGLITDYPDRLLVLLAGDK